MWLNWWWKRWTNRRRGDAQRASGRAAHPRCVARKPHIEELENRTLLSAASLIKQINPINLSSDPSNLTDVNGTLFFTANGGKNPFEVWKSNGTAASTQLVKAFDPNSIFLPSNFTNVNGTLFFLAPDATLWKSDGTPAGTMQVSSSPVDAGIENHLVPVNGELYFTADDGVHGDQLWESDGTADGTQMVSDMGSGALLTRLTNVNGTLFFDLFSSSPSREELWKSDGTGAGTQLVAAVSADYLTNVNGTLFFNGYDDVHGSELWKSDGTAAGTQIVKDINPGPDGSFPYNLTDVNGTLFFTAYDGVHGRELWKSDGTDAGTIELSNFNNGSIDETFGNFTNVNGELYFGSDSNELWKSDGTPAGTVMVSSAMPEYQVAYHGNLFFAASDGSTGEALWRSDGTDAGTQIIKDFHPRSLYSLPLPDLAVVNGTLYFNADDGVHGDELWKSNGTAGGTKLVKDININRPDALPPQGLESTASLNGKIYFLANDGTHGLQLWKSNGTAGGTKLVKSIGPAPFSGGLIARAPFASLTNVNGELYFVANDGTHGFQLWKSNGTAAGTVMVTAINPSGNAFGTHHLLYVPPPSLTNVNGTLYFVATDGTDSYQLWTSDGTAAGTIMLTDINPGGSGPFDVGTLVGGVNPQLTAVGNTLYFVADDHVRGKELWKSDGTVAGTVMVADVHPGSTGGNLSNLTNVGGRLFFTVSPSLPGSTQLWTSNGTAAGTVLVRTIAAQNLTDVNGTLFFTASDGPSSIGLYESDGTAAGTILVMDFTITSGVAAPANLANVNGELFFTADDGVHGAQLWKSDGTQAGTVMVADINPTGSAFSVAVLANLTNVNGTLYFVADDGIHGPELWQSDGTEAGTVIVADINPGSAGSYPENLTVVDGVLYFSADDGIHGRELYRVNP
jgi:ELWxxDGT repeat protein